jgi:hypothetical protein
LLPGLRSSASGHGPLPAGRTLVARWPDLIEAGYFRLTRVVLAAAHLDNNPANSRLANLRGLCQRCHLLHDLPYHRVQRWLTFRRRWAVGDLFLGLYEVQMSLPLFSKPDRMLAGVIIPGGPWDSLRSAQVPMARGCTVRQRSSCR